MISLLPMPIAFYVILQYNKKLFAATLLFVLLCVLCITPTHWPLKLSFTVLISFISAALKGLDVAACPTELAAKLSLFPPREDLEGP